jgi:hypothetical protein
MSVDNQYLQILYKGIGISDNRTDAYLDHIYGADAFIIEAVVPKRLNVTASYGISDSYEVITRTGKIFEVLISYWDAEHAKNNAAQKEIAASIKYDPTAKDIQ